MAKKSGPKEAAMRSQREGKGFDPLATEPYKENLFDADAYQRELEALREKHTTSLRAAIDQAKARRDEAQEALDNLERQLDRVLGRATVIRSGGSATGRTRMSEAQKTEYMSKAESFIKQHREGVGRAEIAAHLALEPIKTSTVVNALKEAKRIKQVGERASTKYLAA